MITTGATGVSNSALRLDQASSDIIWVDCVPLEPSRAATTCCDSYQGTGYSGAVGSPTTRAAGTLGRVTSFVRDKMGRATAVTDGLGRTTRVLYDGNGNVVRMVDPAGRVTSLVYDANDRPVEVVRADGTTIVTGTTLAACRSRAATGAATCGASDTTRTGGP